MPTLEEPRTRSTAVLMGWSPETIRAMLSRGWPFVVVAPPAFLRFRDEHFDADRVPFVPFDHKQPDSELAAKNLLAQLAPHQPGFAVPLYEETVLWASRIEALLRDDPEIFRRARSFLNKAVMKHRAQMKGIRVGACEEAFDHNDLIRFLNRVSQAIADPERAATEPIHLKPLEGAGTAGHHVVHNEAEALQVPVSAFPAVVESHLRGQEFSVEAFVHHGEIVFLNLTEYVRLGHSNIVPAGPELQAHRERVRGEVQKLIDAFGIENGMVHPEYFVDLDGELSFGEVAARVPGGHIFDLMEEAYGFDSYAAFVLSSDPEVPREELETFFASASLARGHAGALMVYPKRPELGDLVVPESVEAAGCFERHTLFDPVLDYLPPRDGFGNHLGTIFVRSDDPEELREQLRQWEEIDFFPLSGESPPRPPARA